jgi:hypothetical protein
MYRFEAHLVKDIETVLTQPGNPFSALGFAFEFPHNDGGRADVIAVSNEGELIAFEAKLVLWKIALNQAYRNTSFSHYSYVVLPKERAQRALSRRHEFERVGVGLCAADSSGLTILIPAMRRRPFQPWLTDCALAYISSNENQCPPSYQLPLSSPTGSVLPK